MLGLFPRPVALLLSGEMGIRSASTPCCGDAALPDVSGHPLLLRAEAAAAALITAYRTPDPGAMEIVWDWFGHRRAWDGMRRYVRLDLGRAEEPTGADDDLVTLDQSRWLVARARGFDGWAALVAFAETAPVASEPLAKPIAGCWSWDELLGRASERRETVLHAGGQTTDAALERATVLEDIEELDLSSSRGLTPAGLRHLSRLPRLQRLNLAGCAVTDDALAVLRKLPMLRTIVLAGTAVTDAGISHLSGCEALEVVDLSGTRTGDGAIGALGGKPGLREFRSGIGVTDGGLALLREFPALREWGGAEPELELLGYDGRPNLLRLRGSFGDAGLAHLARLEGLFALDLDDDGLAISGRGLTSLAALPHVGWLSIHATDRTMPHIAALPRLRFLVCQDTPAGDDGFAALARSRSLEYLWGRRCHNLGTRGFAALSDIPTLRSLSVSCLNVGDEGLAALPRFPALRELMPMDVPDEGYRHVAGCERLDSLVLMYCRETGDRATEWIARLPVLRKYFASYTRATDRTPELLSRMPSLEEITFDSCAQLTDAGVAALARLPRLRRVALSGMPRVTRDAATGFPPGVEVAFG